jgi:hypothetical protein
LPPGCGFAGVGSGGERSLQRRGIVSDNGGEFINHRVVAWLQKYPGPALFTRSRPYRKNDNAHVRQHNWTHVRQHFGYERYDDPRPTCGFWTCSTTVKPRRCRWPLKSAPDTLLVGEMDGRATAVSLDLGVSGTPGILERAAEAGLTDLAEALADLRRTSFRASERIYDNMLAKDRDRRGRPC